MPAFRISGNGVLVREPDRASAYRGERSPSPEEPRALPRGRSPDSGAKTQRPGPILLPRERGAGERRRGSEGGRAPGTPGMAAPATRGDAVGRP